MSVVGLSGISLGLLADQVGMSKSGLFAHFRSRDDVALALLEQGARVADANVVAPAMALPPGLPRLVELFRRWLGWSARAGLSGGCPVAAGIFELDDSAGEVRDAVAAMEEHWRALLCATVKDAVRLGQLSADLDVDQFVWELQALYLGHHASLRFRKDPLSDQRAGKAFEALLARAGAATKPARRHRTPLPASSRRSRAR